MFDLTHRARKYLDDLQPKQFKQVTNRILSLSKDPYPADCKHLSGHPGFRRIDIGEYRICYEVKNGTIYVSVVGARNDDAVYKEFQRING
ncbi:MAG: type II toxin-antitoxin system RelE/ParE family toxin [Nitrospirota bacterium]|nr:type II toxin-antitoxin system RelE/ParE family toxin [Nitrospirota bacterium]